MRTPEQFASELADEWLGFASDESWRSAAIPLLAAWAKEIEDEAYKRGYTNGYARQKYDADWDRVEANL